MFIYSYAWLCGVTFKYTRCENDNEGKNCLIPVAWGAYYLMATSSFIELKNSIEGDDSLVLARTNSLLFA